MSQLNIQLMLLKPLHALYILARVVALCYGVKI